MNPNGAILAAFVGSAAIITWRDFKGPDPEWPLPAPPPYRYVGAGVAFGLLAIFAETVNPKIAAVLAVGLLVGLGFQTAQKKTENKGLGSLNSGNGIAGTRQV